MLILPPSILSVRVVGSSHPIPSRAGQVLAGQLLITPTDDEVSDTPPGYRLTGQWSGGYSMPTWSAGTSRSPWSVSPHSPVPVRSPVTPSRSSSSGGQSIRVSEGTGTHPPGFSEYSPLRGMQRSPSKLDGPLYRLHSDARFPVEKRETLYIGSSGDE